MTGKQIKKAVELAEGFDLIEVIHGFPMIEYRGNSVYITHIKEWEHYPLLLYRAKDGLNILNENNGDEGFVIYVNSVVYLRDGERVFAKMFYDYESTPYLTAQEQALEAALEEVL